MFKRWVTLLFVVAMTFLLAYGVVGLTGHTSWNRVVPQGDELRTYLASNQQATRNHLVTWVYANSSRTSNSMTTEIVRCCMGSEYPLLMLALISVESEFNPTAVSNVGAKGLTQVMWKVWGADLIKAGIAKEERDLFDIKISILAGEYVLKKCLVASNGNVEKALERYLGGRDGYYTRRITARGMDMYVLTR